MREFCVVVEVVRRRRQAVIHPVEHRLEHPLGDPDARRVVDPDAVGDARLHPGQDRDGLVEVVVEDPRPEDVAPRVGELTDHRDPLLVAQRQDAVVLEQHERLLRGLPGHLPVCRVGQDGHSRVLVDERVLEQAQPELRDQDAADGLVEGGLVHGSGRDGVGQVTEGGVEHAHLHVEPGFEGARAGVRVVGGEVLRGQRADGVGVADHPAVEAEFVAEDVGHQPPVARGRDAVEVHVGAHDVAGAGLHRGPERRQVDVVKLGVGDLGVVVVAATAGSAVAGEVLRAGDDALTRVEG